MGPGFTHGLSTGFLHLEFDAGDVQGRWDIALRDLDYALVLDSDGDGAIRWGEVRRRHAAIANYALARLSLDQDTGPCRLRPLHQAVDHHGDGAYTALYFSATCPTSGHPLRIGYRLLFDLDPSHRGILRVEHPGGVATAVLSPASPDYRLAATETAWEEFVRYFREGVRHIGIGPDHVLFLVALLLPAALRRRASGWQPATGLRPTLTRVLRIVTAFTLAHTLTLSLALFGWVTPSPRWVEPLIAGTVLLAALDNLRPVLPAPRWAVAFGLGLIHGFGFAGVLGELHPDTTGLWRALAGFNLGVESGQVLVVAALVPFAYLSRHSGIYRTMVLQGGSIATALVATCWLLERSLAFPMG